MMKKFNFIRDGATSKLPPGFRFQPTDQEIVFQYLARKVFSCPLPASVIPEFHVFASHPSDLPGDSEMDRYFFASREVNLGNAGGFWKATGSDRRITLSSSSSRRSFPIVGMKRTLVFYQGKHPRAVRTDWFAHVYYISTSAEADRRRRRQGGTVQIGKWVLCHVFMKRRGLKEQSYEEMSSEGESSCSSSSSSASDSSVVSEEVSSAAAADV